MAVVPYDAAGARAQLINQEDRVQGIRLEETYVQYSEYLQYTEYDVRMQIDGHSARLQQLEEVAEHYRDSADESETRLVVVEMQQARMLHAERDALLYAAAEHRQARHHAEQVFAFAGFSEALQGELAHRDQRAMATLSDIVTQGRAKVQAWRCFARSQQEATLLEAEAHRSLSEQFQVQKLEWRQQYDGMNLQILQLHNEVHAEMSQRDVLTEAETRAILALRHEVALEVGQKNFCIKAEMKFVTIYCRWR
jgi:hypothetical protein